jgi:hypothetical protein
METERLFEDIIVLETRKTSMQAMPNLRFESEQLSKAGLHNPEALIDKREVQQRGGQWSYQVGHDTKPDDENNRTRFASGIVRQARKAAEEQERISTWGF